MTIPAKKTTGTSQVATAVNRSMMSEARAGVSRRLATYSGHSAPNQNATTRR